ncbi:PH domain-containing protein, partial [Micrococcus luteus]
ASLVLGPVIRWRTARFHVSADGVQVDSGLLSRRFESLPWDLVTSVDHRQPWAFQLLGITEVTCTQTGEDGSRVRLDGLAPADLAAFQRHADAAAALGRSAQAGSSRVEDIAASRVDDDGAPADRAGAAPADQADRAPTGQADAADAAAPAAVVHRTTLADLLVLSLVYGQVLLLVPPVAFGLMELTDVLGLTERLESLLFSGLGSWPTALLIVALAVVVGLTATVVKFHGFTVLATPEGRLRIRYGLVSTHERVITPGAVQGVVWHRNAAEQLLGRARLSVLTLDSAAQLGGNLVLPSMPVERARAIVAEHLPEFAGTARRLSTGLATPAVNLVSLLALAAAFAGTWVLTAQTWGWPWPLAAGACLAAAAVVAGIIAVATARLYADPAAGLFLTRRITVGERVTAVRATRLHGISAHHLHHARTPRGRRTAWLPTVFYFAGAPRRAMALVTAPEAVEALQAMVRHSSVPLRA